MERDTMAEEKSNLLRQYIKAMSDPTRGEILMELAHAGELTPTQLARRLGLTANNVYHHMRVLRELGVVGPPRAEPRETYVEKYYQITPELLALTRNDPYWVDRTQENMAPGDRKALIIGMYLTVARLLTRAARRYEAMDDAEFEDLIYERQLGMVSVNDLSRERLVRRLASLRETIRAEHEVSKEDETSGGEASDKEARDTVIMVSLPQMWDDEGGSAER
jgi:DNA-binding transcriptional ArsR family regulator